ncbi:hypothetical protein C1I98_04635 [Spongiactinospora gelatinilytica]|uniref:MFS transporter n=1 Tax=Spongiactinospora gelatinilytica TaxID=2666298 RepID=A0A2W2HR63_9ACTN|nr:hypothetical protein [Spongiactinospora gelatinilytica]PZG54135.1 hypothetical protein C1I98_04635 [Spongiactinospora gelatinilytica]
MNTYREVFAVGEFRTLFGARTASIAGKTTQMLALSTLVYHQTRSPLLLALPYLGFLTRPPVAVAAVLVAVASFGFAAHLGAQERHLDAIPERRRGQALGLAGTGLLTGQALAASLSGSLAEVLPVHQAMAAMAGASLVATACLLPHLRYRADDTSEDRSDDDSGEAVRKV